MDDESTALRAAIERALTYVRSVDERRVFPDDEAIAALAGFDEPFPDAGRPVDATLAMLDELGGPATVASTGADYFGFVTGATLPAALGAAWMTAAWDQNAALPVMSPVAARLHAVVRGWLVDALHLPPATAVAFVTGATVANAAGLAAGRDALLARAGWDAQADGLFGAPPATVVVGEQAHSTLVKSLGLVGLGRRRVLTVPADEQGRMRVGRLPDVAGPVLVCAQAGEVNTGAFDPFDPIADWIAERDGWLHVDGAFGLWAAADPSREHLVEGLGRADSWATDGHKWLNVTYDCGLAFVRDRADLARTFSARALADRLRAGGATVVNDVVLNQVLVRFGDGPTTEAVIAEVQAGGEVWCGSTSWRGEPAMRVSVSSWRTTVADARRAADVILAARDTVTRA